MLSASSVVLQTPARGLSGLPAAMLWPLLGIHHSGFNLIHFSGAPTSPSGPSRNYRPARRSRNKNSSSPSFHEKPHGEQVAGILAWHPHLLDVWLNLRASGFSSNKWGLSVTKLLSLSPTHTSVLRSMLLLLADHIFLGQLFALSLY